MSETLSQAEIDALREAVKSGDALGEEEQQAPEQLEDQIKVISYDFRKPLLLSSDQLHALQLLHESVGKDLQAALFSSVKTALEIKLVAVDQISYGEFVLSMSNPTYLLLLSAAPHGGHVAMEISLSTVMPVLDILLGGPGTAEDEPRELTILESSIFRGIAQTCLGILGGAWGGMTDTKFDIVAERANPETLQMTTPESSCLCLTFDVHLGEATGVLNLCYPFQTIQAIFAAAKKRSDIGRVAGVGNVGDGNEMMAALGLAPLEASVVIGHGVLSAEQVAHLSVGDVLCLDRRCDEPVDITVGKNIVFRAAIGQHHGKAAALIMDTCVTGSKKNAETNIDGKVK